MLFMVTASNEREMWIQTAPSALRMYDCVITIINGQIMHNIILWIDYSQTYAM